MKLYYLLLLPIAILATSACNSLTGETETVVKAEEGVPGGEVTETTTFKATVTGIDTTKRLVTLVTNEGKKFKFDAGQDVPNFDQIAIGDQLTVTSIEKVAIRMAKPGEKIEEHITYGDINLPPLGDKPSLRVSDSLQSSAIISDINTKRRKVTLQFADGSTKKYDVRDDLNLAERKLGERVVIRLNTFYEIVLE